MHGAAQGANVKSSRVRSCFGGGTGVGCLRLQRTRPERAPWAHSSWVRRKLLGWREWHAGMYALRLVLSGVSAADGYGSFLQLWPLRLLRTGAAWRGAGRGARNVVLLVVTSCRFGSFGVT